MGAAPEIVRTSIGIPNLTSTAWSDLLPFQRDAVETDAGIIISEWGRGTGKSSTLTLKAQKISFRWPRLRVLVVAPSQKTLDDGIFSVIAQSDDCYREQYGHSLIAKWSTSPQINKLTWANGSMWKFRLGSRIDDVRGGSYGMILIEEAGYVEATQVSWSAFVPCLRGYGPHVILAGGTPASPTSVLEVLKEVHRQGKARTYYSQAATFQNPHFPATTLDLMRATLSREAWEREVEGKMRTLSGLVYPEWDPRIHVIDFDPVRELTAPGWELYEIVDWGYNLAHRTTIAVRQLDPSEPPTVVVVRDIPLERVSTETICKGIAADFNRLPINARAVIADPYPPQAFEAGRKILYRYGLQVVAEKRPERREVVNTAEFVRRMLMSADGKPHLFVTREVAAQECNRPGGRGTCASFATYRLTEAVHGSGVFRDKPKDDNYTAHAMDCLRYWPINMHRFGYRWPIVVRYPDGRAG